MIRPQEAVLRIRGLTKRRGDGHVAFELEVPELSVRPGEILVLQGASGSGKSTLLDILSLSLRPDRAESFVLRPPGQRALDAMRVWQREDLNELGRLRALHMGYVLQTGGLLPFMSARENVALPCRLLGRSADDRVRALAQRMDIEQELDKMPAQLSVGERQRIAIARALVHSPTIVLADEPTASVDPVNAGTIIDLFLHLVRSTGIAAVVATHDWRPRPSADVTLAEHRLEQDGALTRALFWTEPTLLTA